MTWRPLLAFMVLLTLLCVAGPHVHADTPPGVAMSGDCHTGTLPHEHEASCDADVIQAPAVTAPALDEPRPGRATQARPAVLAARLLRSGPLLTMLCLSRI
ncbi:hypothetical protein OIE66_20595 [Nonomuraea sp. NBC_01738]|uniref:hypothetical protein n=1 Tax=Nonomuraea sp. NBC_01738 TaxID=2976003 RepID=UPI002E161B18|nr:hypothetical protein OIE66_20595 [Nonomuraea sp. NBC_01738]